MSEGNSSVQVQGRSINDAVTLFVQDKVFEGWKEVSISRRINQLASSFSLSLTDTWTPNAQRFQVLPGNRAHIHVGEETILDGYVDAVNLSISANDRTVEVTGRSNALDLVDCSHDGATEFSDSTMEAIVKKILSPFENAPFRFNSPGGDLGKITIRQGETIKEVIDRMARQKKLVAYSGFNGEIIFSKQGATRARTEIIEGVNMLSASVSHNHANRFSIYKVKGQTSGLEGLVEQSTKNTGDAFDRGIKRYRPMVILAENAVNAGATKERAQYEADIRAAQGSRFSVVVQGWFQENGQLWDINQRVGFKSKFLGFSGDLLIEGITYSKSSGGTVCTLELVRPDAYTFPPEIPESGDLSQYIQGDDDESDD